MFRKIVPLCFASRTGADGAGRCGVDLLRWSATDDGRCSDSDSSVQIQLLAFVRLLFLFLIRVMTKTRLSLLFVSRCVSLSVTALRSLPFLCYSDANRTANVQPSGAWFASYEDAGGSVGPFWTSRWTGLRLRVTKKIYPYNCPVLAAAECATFGPDFKPVSAVRFAVFSLLDDTRTSVQFSCFSTVVFVVVVVELEFRIPIDARLLGVLRRES